MKMDCPDLYPLHSAIRSSDLEAAELLLNERVDIYSKDEKGRTPLELLVQERIELLTSIDHVSKLQSVEMNEKFIDLLLKHSSTDQEYTDDMQLLNFHAACMLTKCSTIERLLEKFSDINQSISMHSSFFPGYTALHFAVYSNTETLKVLITKGADMLARDATGVTPLDICLRFHKLEDKCSILACVTAWKNILFSNGETRLMEYLDCLKDENRHNHFLENTKEAVTMSLPEDAPVWPGYTILHLAVTLSPDSVRHMIERIASRSGDVTVQNSDGSTPIHLAYRQVKWGQYRKSIILGTLFDHHKKVVNPLDKDSLSHLHIACAVNATRVVKKLLSLEANVDIVYEGATSLPEVEPGWTPLLTAAFTKNSILTAMLVRRGANLLRTDAEGFTAIHRLFGTNGNKRAVIDALSDSENFKDCTVEGVGLTHLHVMISWKMNVESIEKLLDQGANIEATIVKANDRSLIEFEGCRPLHLAVENGTLEIVEVLLQRGADIFAKKPDGTSPLSQVLSGEYSYSLLERFTSLLWTNDKLQKRMKEEMGLTMLHVACYALDSEKVETLLKKGADVNARMFDDYCFWPGFTPLHVLTSLWNKNSVKNLLDLLLKEKADVGLANAEGETPVHFILESRNSIERTALLNDLLNYYRNFNVNPTNTDGLSLFHVACLACNFTAVKKFLQCGADVNQPVNESAKRYAACSPLHLILIDAAKPADGAKLLIHTVDLLLKYGANVDAVDVLGRTPLHNLAQYSSIQGRIRNDLLNKIVRADTDINRETIAGNTPYEDLICHGTSTSEIEYFMKKGCRVNGYNRISGKGYMGMILSFPRYKKCWNSVLKLMMNLPDIAEINVGGRNAIHNAIAGTNNQITEDEFEDLIEKLMQLGCELHHQDCSGKTPLHLAVELGDVTAVSALLACGADINVVDYAGQSPFSQYLSNERYYFHSKMFRLLVSHLSQLRDVGLRVSKLNISLLNDERENISSIGNLYDGQFLLQLNETKNVKIGLRGLSLHDFVFQNNAAKIISQFNHEERNDVTLFFNSTTNDKDNYKNRFSSLRGLLKLQYRKVFDKLSLSAPAARSLDILLGFPMPDLCVIVIFKFLNNADLRNLISATIDVGDELTGMIVD